MKFFAAAAAALLAAACASGALDDTRLAPAGLYALAAPDDLAALAGARRHVLVVRHAKKTPGCNAADCPLTAEGRAEAQRLATLLDGVDVAARASAACRTSATAQTGAGAAPVVHQMADGRADGCAALGLEPGSRTRVQAIAAVTSSPARWTLVAEHSDTLCLWVAAFAGDAGGKCAGGALATEDYGDIFWLHQDSAGAWSLTTLEDAFGENGPG